MTSLPDKHINSSRTLSWSAENSPQRGPRNSPYHPKLMMDPHQGGATMSSWSVENSPQRGRKLRDLSSPYHRRLMMDPHHLLLLQGSPLSSGRSSPEGGRKLREEGGVKRRFRSRSLSPPLHRGSYHSPYGLNSSPLHFARVYTDATDMDATDGIRGSKSSVEGESTLLAAARRLLMSVGGDGGHQSGQKNSLLPCGMDGGRRQSQEGDGLLLEKLDWRRMINVRIYIRM